MIPSLSQETITEYASEAQTIQEPTGTDYTQGVRVGKTVPAKWWNWLFRGATRRLGQAKTDAQNMLTEMQNVVTDAGFTLSASDSHQMSKSVVKDADTQIDKYIYDKKNFMTQWYPITRTAEGATLVAGSLQRLGSKHLVALFADGGSTYVCISTDGINWHIIYHLSSVPSGKSYLGIVYFNSQYFVYASGLLSGYSDRGKSVLLSTVDGTDFSTVFEHSTSGTVLDAPFIATAADSMLVIKEVASSSTIYSEDGVNFSNLSGYSNLGKVLNRSCFNCTMEAIQLTENKFVVFVYLVDTQLKTVSNILGESCYGYHGATKLLSGAVAISYTNNQSIPFERTRTIVVPASGDSWYVNDSYVKYRYQTSRLEFGGYLFKTRGSQDNTIISYSSDGTTFTDMPSNIAPSILVDGYAFFSAAFGSSQYRTQGTISSDRADYELLGTFGSFEKIALGPVVNGRRVIGMGGSEWQRFSTDYGDTWTSIVSTSKPSMVNVPVGIAAGVFTEYVYSNLLINKVSGFTLYLR